MENLVLKDLYKKPPITAHNDKQFLVHVHRLRS